MLESLLEGLFTLSCEGSSGRRGRAFMLVVIKAPAYGEPAKPPVARLGPRGEVIEEAMDTLGPNGVEWLEGIPVGELLVSGE